jgi:redox-sensitive bicupin YhaK (pirin superfamily)
MIRQTPAKIYKAYKRGLTESSRQRLHAIFNFEKFQDESRLPFGGLKVFNEETLAPDHYIARQTEADTLTLLIPLTGALKYSHRAEAGNTIVPGEVAIITSPEVELTLTNPYEDGLINYLYITFDAYSPLAETQTATVNLEERNTLHQFINRDNIYGYMAIFDGRKETIYKMKDPANGLFLFVINGAFEVQGRLLEERDGLALWDTDEVDMEALSENAIILVFEVPLTGFTA